MAELKHFNIHHDPKTGQFTFSTKYRNADGSLTEAGIQREYQRIENKDNRWAKRNYDRLYKKAYKPVKKDMKKFVKNELNPRYAQQIRSGKISRSYMNEYNRMLASLMNQNVDSLPTAPSGRVIKFIAMRGDIGVHMALADASYDISKLKSGVYRSGKIAYRNQNVNMA